jgi:hypothetical protein
MQFKSVFGNMDGDPPEFL